MPELPEVETLRRDLEASIAGETITSVELLDEKKVRNDKEDFIEAVTGAEIERVERRAKLLMIELANGNTILVHLKITGQLLLRPDGAPEDRFTRAVIHLDGKELRFADMRRFGFLKVVPTAGRDRVPELSEFGIEPFDPAFTFDMFKKLIGHRKTKIKPLLMDQHVITGLGNIYADEVLFLAKVRPQRAAESLSDAELKRIYENIRPVLEEAIGHRGSSVDSYVDLKGEQGGHVPFIKVYRRTGLPCFVCGTAIERIKLGSRSAHYCPHCQK